VRNILHKKRDAGIREYKGQQLQLAMRLRSESGQQSPPARKYLLTGLVYCGVCGERLNGTQRKDHATGPLRRIYQCQTSGDVTRPNCGKVRRNADALDHFIRECVFYRLETPELAALLASGSPDDAQLKALLSDRASLHDRLSGLADQYILGELTKDQVARATATAQAELHRIEREIDRLNRERHGLNLSVGETLRSAWDSSGSTEWRRNLLSLLIKKIDVYPSRRSRCTSSMVCACSSTRREFRLSGTANQRPFLSPSTGLPYPRP
jgi:site-specific DNA recombinase